MSQYIKTYGRIRPSAKGSESSAFVVNDKTVKVETENGLKSYELHRIFNSEATQEEVFVCVSKKIVEDSAEGFNGTIFAYGQTGSGKTHTMLGPCNSWSDPERKGLIPRTVEYLFVLLDKKAQECQKFTFSVDVEFVELYNEDIFDLLNMKNKVQLRDSGKDIQLVGAKAETVDNSLDLMHVVQRGWQSRSTGSTAMNNESSRSHALLIIKIKTQEVTGELVKERFSTLNLVDLAGSERQSHTKAVGDRLKEATNINSSLTVLGRCIRILSKPTASNTFVPYRDSHLTHILKNSLGGNSKTAVIVNMHPDREFLPESSSTLMFAQSCTMIKNAVTRNEVMTGDQENSYKKAIQELRKEVDETRAKARDEFAKKLDEAENIRLSLTAENDSLKADNIELRAKYNCALAKYNTGAGTDLVVNEFKKALSQNVDKFSNSSLRDLASKNLTMKLECEAGEKRCYELQQELDTLMAKYQDNLNTTLQMSTPKAKERRSSSRPKRRETQYKPSPARIAELAETDENEHQLELEIRNEQLECEVQTMRCKLEKAEEQKARMQCDFEQSRNILLKKLDENEINLKAANHDIDELIKKNERAKNDLEKSLLRISMQDKEIAQLNNSKIEASEKFAKEMEEMIEHHKKQIADLEQKCAETEEISSVLSDSQKEVDEKAAQNLVLRQQLDSISDKYDVLEQNYNKQHQSDVILRNTIDTHEQAIEDLRKQLTLKSEIALGLQQDLNKKSKMTNNVEEDLKTKSNLIKSLEDDVMKKAEFILKLQAEISKASEAFERRYSELKKSEEYEKKRFEELQKKANTEFEGYQRDVKNMRANKEQEISSLQRSLAVANERLNSQELSLKKKKAEDSRKFDEQVAEIEKRFKNANIDALKTQEEKIKRESLNLMESSLLAKDEKIRELENRIEFYVKQHSEDSEIISNQLGSKQSKMLYIEKIRREKAEAEAVVAQQRTEIARLSKGNREANRPVLRSRNQQ